LLLDGDNPPDQGVRDRLLRNIKHSADRMNGLVSDLLDLARLRSHRADLQLRRVDLGDLVEGAAAMMRPLIEQAGQSLTLAIPVPAPSVLGDPRRLERVLTNLLSNATKFAPRDAKIDVVVQRRPDGVLVSVSDTGPGISSEAMPRLFEQFYTSRSSSSIHNIGTGLGLPIAKGIVEAHGGRIWAESEPGHGATFHVELPWEAPAQEEAE
jgi:signal transduction histidine kinase